MTATAAATLTPVKVAGSALGASRWRSCCQRLGVEAAQQLARVGVDVAQPVVEVDRDREEAHERDQQDLRREAEAEHEDQQRRDDRDRHGLRADHQRAQRLADRRGQVHGHAERHADHDRRGEAQHDLPGRDREVLREQCAVGPQRLGDVGRRGEQQRVDDLGAHERLPAGEQHEHDGEGGHQSSSASSARSRSSTTAKSVRARGLGMGDVERLDDPSGARREQHDPVGQQDRLLDIVRDQQHGARLLQQRIGEPALHLPARERVERAERLVQAQHRPPGQQRAQERDALAHAAAQLARPRLLEALQPERGEVLVGGGPRGRARLAAHPQRQPGVVQRAQPRQQPVALGHQRRGRRAHLAGVGRAQPAHQLEQRRLPAPARPDHRDRLVRGGAQRHAVQRDDVAVGLAHPGDHHVAAGL